MSPSSTQNSQLTYRSAFVFGAHTDSLQSPSRWDNKEDGPSSFWHQGQGGGSQLPRASQGNPSPPTARRAIRVSRLDSKPCIPRTAESIVTLLKTPELFPGLREDEIEKWVRVCEHYRDKTCSSEEVGSPEPSNWGKVQGKYPPRQTKATHNQQDTSDVEYRQSPDIHDDLNDAEEKSNPE